MFTIKIISRESDWLSIDEIFKHSIGSNWLIFWYLVSSSSNNNKSEIVLRSTFIKIVVLPRLVPSSQLLIRKRRSESPILILGNINSEIVEKIIDTSSRVRIRNNSISVSVIDEDLITGLEEVRVQMSGVIGSGVQEIYFIVAGGPLEVGDVLVG